VVVRAARWQARAFAQLTYRESLRDIEVSLAAQAGKLYHMGISAAVARSTLADANESRDWRIYFELSGRPPNRGVLRTNFTGRAQPTHRSVGRGGLGADLLAHSPHITRAPLMPRKPLIWDDACPRPRAREIK
jgi:hypothetical protein